MPVLIYMVGALEPKQINVPFEDVVLNIGQIKQGGNALAIGRDCDGARVAVNVDRILTVEEITDEDE